MAERMTTRMARVWLHWDDSAMSGVYAARNATAALALEMDAMRARLERLEHKRVEEAAAADDVMRAIQDRLTELEALATNVAKSPTPPRGLYDKYRVTRKDGKDGKDIGPYFVLEPETDRAACAALYAYALHTDNERLKNELIDWWRRIEERHHEEAQG